MYDLLVVHALVVVALFVVVVPIAIRLCLLFSVFSFCFFFVGAIVLVVGGGVAFIVGEVTTIVILACNTAVNSNDIEISTMRITGRVIARRFIYYLRMELDRISRHPRHVTTIIIVVVFTLETTRLREDSASQRGFRRNVDTGELRIGRPKLASRS